MSRNVSGVYSLPAVYEATPGETILSVQHNTPLEDLEADANIARPYVAGGTGVSDRAKLANPNVSANALQLLLKLLAGMGTVGGTATAVSLTTGLVFTGYGTGDTEIGNGQLVAFKATSAATGASTLAPDGLATRKIRRKGDSAIVANDWVSGETVLLRYHTAYDTGTGAWELVNQNPAGAIAAAIAALPAAPSAASTTEALTGTDTAKFITADALAALWEKAADVASAATITFGEGGFFHIIGSTGPIADIDWATAKNGRWAWVYFDSTPTLTHSASLLLPGGANITAAAGDRALFIQDNGDNVVCLVYQRADGKAIAADVTLTNSITFTNKRITPRIVSEASNATPTPNADTTDQHNVTAAAANMTIGSPTGTPTDGQRLLLRFKDNGSARTIGWNAIFRAMGVALPTTTVISKTLYVGCIYNSADSKWDVIATGQEA